MILNGIKSFDTASYNLAEFDERTPYIDYVRKVYGRSIIENAIMNFYEFFIDSITLEICPTSNVDTKVVDDISEHPIKKLNDLGVLITINTDNRTVSNTNLNKEYEILQKEFNFSDEDFLQFNLNAINCAFISEKEKELLRKELLN